VKSEFPKEQNLYNEYVWNEKSKSYEVVSKTEYITSKDLSAVYDSQITIKQGDVVKGTFSLNQSGNKTINLDAPPTNTKSLLVTYEDGTQETIKVYTA
jgi:VCBS repeat-containing protein